MTWQVTVAGTNHRFPCDTGESLLDAAQRAGLELPYSCRKGVCGNCAGGLESGRVIAAGTVCAAPDERILYCRSTPSSDVTIRPLSIRLADKSARKRLHAKVHRIDRLAEDVTLLRLRFPAGVRIRFRAGQYLHVLLDDGGRRQFSMANPPGISDEAHLHIRHVPGGYFTGTVLPRLERGQQLEVELPFGDFHWREGHEGPLIFVATGTGFAPIASIVEDMFRRNMARPFSFYWGGRSLRHLYALEMVDAWRARHAGLRFVPVVSHEVGAIGGRSGMVHHAVLADFPDLSGAHVYACGSPAMIAAAREEFVQRAGLPPAHFFSDAFVAGPGTA